MKRIPPSVAAATPCLFATWCSLICLAAFLTTVSASAAMDAQPTSEGLSPAEEWVVEQVSVGKIADLSEKFPDEEKEKRKLSGHFLEDLLIGSLPGVKPYRNRVLIRCAMIDNAIDLDGLLIPYQVMLEFCQFNSSVSFLRTIFATSVSFDSSSFEKEASFNSMKVGGSAFFHNTVFKGPVNFLWASIANNFEVDRAQFLNKKETVQFNGMKVGSYAVFKDAVFEGSVKLNYTDFALLDLSSAFWPKIAAQFQMHGMSYKYVRAVRDDEPKSHKALLKLADQSAYSADVYSNLEDFFLRQGYRDDADRAFIHGKHRERKQLSVWRPAWFGSMLLNLLVGYGRHPWQALIPCAVLVLIGCILFTDERMELQKKPERGDARRVYNRFWYSLGLFLPFVNLQTAELWKPKNRCSFLRNYVRVHILLGWILVPIALAALTGLIK